MDDIIQDILRNPQFGLLGTKSGGYYAAGIIWSFAGILLSLYWRSRKRDPSSPHTPERFSWLFLFWDNCKIVGISLLVMFVIFRTTDLSNVFLMISVGILVALGLDQLLGWLIGKSELLCKLLGMNRDKFPQKPTE